MGGEEADEEEELADLREADRETDREVGDGMEAVGAVLSKLRLRFMTCSPKVVREPTVCPLPAPFLGIRCKFRLGARTYFSAGAVTPPELCCFQAELATTAARDLVLACY